MPSGFKVTDTTVGFSSADFDDLFVKTDFINEGGLWNWGYNSFVQCGTLGINATTDRSSPVQTISGGGDWRIISAGSRHTASIKIDGTLWVWGSNLGGALALDSTTPRSSPVQTIAAATNWVDVSAGNIMTLALKRDGTLWSWGFNSAGQLGDNSTTNKSSPVQTISGGTNWIKLVASDDGAISSGIKTDGTLWLWGCNDRGQIGNDSTTNRSSPVQTISGGGNWTSISLGSRNAGAIKTDGTLWMWGYGSRGVNGNQSNVHQSSPVQTVSGGGNWKDIALGSDHAAAIKIDGTLWLWGSNGVPLQNGVLGDNTIVSKSSPVQTISGGGNWKRVAAGGDNTASIKTDGTLWIWGYNAQGQLGNNSIEFRSSPVQTVPGGTQWTSISVGCRTISALRYDCW